MRLRAAVMVSSASAALLFTAAPAAAQLPARPAGPVHAVQRPVTGAVFPGPAAAAKNDYFNSISCSSTTSCMAVGSYQAPGAVKGLSEQLGGATWTGYGVPFPLGYTGIFANEVSCPSVSFCLLVGDAYLYGSTAPGMQLAEAWIGTRWAIVQFGSFNTSWSYYNDVSCPLTTFCMIVGQAGSGPNGHATAATFINNGRWKFLALSAPPHAQWSELGGLSCASATMCMAVGNYANSAGQTRSYAELWRAGYGWKIFFTPNISGEKDTYFQGVSCPTTSECMAVGNTYNPGTHEFAEIWRNGTWTVSAMRILTNAAFIGASCPAADRCYASGWYGTAPLVETWNGTGWTMLHPRGTSAPDNADVLMHISCAGRYYCEAAGYRYNPSIRNSPDATLAEVFKNGAWTIQGTVNK